MERNKYNKVILSGSEQQWVRDNFSRARNAEVAEHLGISPRTVIRIARDMGLSKDPAFMRAMQRNASEHGSRVNRANGGNAGAKNLLLYGKAYRFKAGESNRDRMGEEAFREMHHRIGESRKETFRKERRRVLFGLEQKTRLKVVACPREKICLRHNLRRHGYEVGRGANEAYITEYTRRNPVMEARAEKMGMSFIVS